MMTTNNDPKDGKVIFRETTKRFWVLRLVTEVRDTGLYIRLEPLQRSFRRIPVAQIEDVSIEPYSATTYSGWHWGLRRTASANTVYRLHGDRGVELVLTNGKHWFIGSQHPEELQSAIERLCE